VYCRQHDDFNEAVHYMESWSVDGGSIKQRRLRQWSDEETRSRPAGLWSLPAMWRGFATKDLLRWADSIQPREIRTGKICYSLRHSVIVLYTRTIHNMNIHIHIIYNIHSFVRINHFEVRFSSFKSAWLRCRCV